MDITAMIEEGESEMTCLAAATQRAEKARRTVRAYEAELCAMFETRNAAKLAEDMTLLTETAEGPVEAKVSVLKDVLEMTDKVEAYKTWSEITMATATDLMQTAVRRHAEGGGCSQCTGGGQEQQEGRKPESLGRQSFVVYGGTDAWNEQCDSCKMQREQQEIGPVEGTAGKIMEQLWRQMNEAIEAAGVTSREQMFFASRVERAMQLDEAPETRNG